MSSLTPATAGLVIVPIVNPMSFSTSGVKLLAPNGTVSSYVLVPGSTAHVIPASI